MKPASILKALIPILMTLMILSCSQGTAMKAPGTGHVRLTTAIGKSLSVTDAGGIDHYEYSAHPQFSLNGDYVLYGETDWKEVGGDSGSSEIIGPFTQGYWKFGVRAIVESGEPMWEGSGEGYIAESSLSVIPITMHRAEGVGTVLFEIDIPETAAGMPDPIIAFDEAPATISWTHIGTGEGTISYRGTLNDIPAGWHSLTVRFIEGNVEIGDAMAIQIVPGATVTLRGRFEIGTYDEPYFTIDSPTAARGEIRMSGSGNRITNDSMEKGETHTYAYALTSGRKNVTVNWYVNGEKKNEGATFAFTPEANGTYEIAAISRYYAESVLGGAWIEESTSASITVIVHPEISTLTWKSGMMTTIQRLPYETVLTVGAPIREGYEFSHWAVTGGLSGNISSGYTFTVSKPSYTFEAVWNEKPSVKLELSSSNRLAFNATSATTIPSEGIQAKLTSASSYAAKDITIRWFLDNREVFWICDRGDGTFRIPGSAEAGITPGKYPLTAQAEFNGMSVSARMNVTWQ